MIKLLTLVKTVYVFNCVIEQVFGAKPNNYFVSVDFLNDASPEGGGDLQNHHNV